MIRVLACSVCGTDLRAWQHGNERITPPRITGHELCGQIVEIGPAARASLAGDRVSVVPAIGCGECPSCRRGYTNLCDNLQTIGFQFDGGFAEYMEVPAVAFRRGHVYETPANVPDEVAALAEPIACVVNGQEFLHIQQGRFGGHLRFGLHRLHARRAGPDERRGPDHHDRAQREPGAAAHALIPFSSLIVPGKVDLAPEVKRLTGGQGRGRADHRLPRGPGPGRRRRPGGQAGPDQPLRRPGEGDEGLPGQQPDPLQGAVDPRRARFHRRAEPDVMDWIAAGKLDRAIHHAPVSPEQIEQAFRDLQSQAVFKAVVKP